MAFILMNKDFKVAELKIIGNDAFISVVYSNIPEYINDVTSWLNSRTPPIGRRNVLAILKQAQINSFAEYLSVTKAISLTDTFWVQDTDNSITWDRISPYRNRLSRIISNIALNCEYHGGELRSPSPDYTVDGSVDKCWKRLKDGIYLFKTDGEKWSGITGNRPYCEYYACQVAEQLGVKHNVQYGITVKKTANGCLKPYTYCRAFTNEKYGYVPIAYTKYTYTPLIELYKLLSSNDRLLFREMLLLDSIIVNFDRHEGNYGFLFDTDSLKLVGMAPIFDNDCGLGPYMSLKSASIAEAYEELIKTRQPKTDLGGYIKQARMSLTQELVSNMKNMYPFHFDRLPKEIDLEDERIEFMEYIVNNQIKAILGRGGTV